MYKHSLVVIFSLALLITFVHANAVQNNNESKMLVKVDSSSVNFLGKTLGLRVGNTPTVFADFNLSLRNATQQKIYTTTKLGSIATSNSFEFDGKVNGKYIPEGKYVFYLEDSKGKLVSNYAEFEVYYNTDFVEMQEQDFHNIYPISNPTLIPLPKVGFVAKNTQVVVLDGLFSSGGIQQPVFSVETNPSDATINYSFEDAYFYKNNLYLLNKDSLSSDEKSVITYLKSNPISDAVLVNNRTASNIEKTFNKDILKKLLDEGILIKRPLFMTVSVDLNKYGKIDNSFKLDFSLNYNSFLSSLTQINYEISAVRNIKDISKYNAFGNNPVFLISNENWKEILQLVPATTWTGTENNCNKINSGIGNICAYPTLIYHTETENQAPKGLKLDESQFSTSVSYNTSDLGKWTKTLSSELNPSKTGPFITINDEKNKVILTYHISNVGSITLTAFPSELELIEPQSNTRIVNNTQSEATFTFKIKPGSILPEIKTKNFDADSIIHFMQQYHADSVIAMNPLPQDLEKAIFADPEFGAGIKKNAIYQLGKDLTSFWENNTDTVYVEDNYSSALLAASYASLINAPLIITGSSLDTENNFKEKNVICVGTVSRKCDEQYAIKELQQKYLSITKTSKYILTNPNDLGNYVTGNFQLEHLNTEKGTSGVKNLFGDTSLTAPFLAAAKQELIITTTNSSFSTVDKDFTNQFLNLKPNTPTTSTQDYYLTIIASPVSIQTTDSAPEAEFQRTTDWKYGKSLIKPIFYTGRIYAYDISDASAYIARDLFFDSIEKNKKATFLFPNYFESDTPKTLLPNDDPHILNSLSKKFPDTVYSCVTDSDPLTGCITHSKEVTSNFFSAYFVYYSGHGWIDGTVGLFDSGDMRYKYFQPKISLILACFTCDFAAARKKFALPKLFCMQNIRRGDLAYVGAQSTSGGSPGLGIAKLLVENRETIGKALYSYQNRGFSVFLLIGDPTFTPIYWETE